MVFKTEAQLNKEMTKACSKAIQKTCKKLWEKLQDLIEKNFYDAYTPKPPEKGGYRRTYQFYYSALYGMVSDLCGIVFMDMNGMKYEEPEWTGRQQLIAAEMGYHGCKEITGGGEFWSEFLTHFGTNALPMLKKELQAQGIPVK